MRSILLFICALLLLGGWYVYRNYYEVKPVDESGLLSPAEMGAMTDSCVDADGSGYMKFPLRGTPLRVVFYESSWAGNVIEIKLYTRPEAGREWAMVSLEGELIVKFRVPAELFAAREPVRVGTGGLYHTYRGVIRQNP